MEEISQMFVNDILSFVTCKMNIVPKEKLLDTIKYFYSQEDICEALSILSKTNHIDKLTVTGDSAADIYNYLTVISKSDLPLFVCKNLNNIPYFTENLEDIDDNFSINKSKERTSQKYIHVVDMKKEQHKMKVRLYEISIAVNELKDMVISLEKKGLLFDQSLQRRKFDKLIYTEKQNNLKLDAEVKLNEAHKGWVYLQMLIDEEEENEARRIVKMESIESDVEADEFNELERYLEEGYAFPDEDHADSFEIIEHQIEEEEETVSRNQQVIVLTPTPTGPKTKVLHADADKILSQHVIHIKTIPSGLLSDEMILSDNGIEVSSLSDTQSVKEIEAQTDPTRNYLQVNEDGSKYLKECPKYPKLHLEEEEDPLIIPSQLSCSLCGTPFECENDLIEHTSTHTRGAILSCFFCGFANVELKRMKDHLKKHNSPNKAKKEKKARMLFKCIQCKFQSTHINRIHTHVDLHFEKISDNCYECQLCLKRYKEHASLRKHRIGHAGIRPFVCKICGANFFLKSYLNLHIRYSHSEKPFQCSFCTYRFSQKSTLVLHERTHTGEKPFKCDRCDYRAIGSKTLLEHQRNKHMDHKPFECSTCMKGFHVHSRLLKHMKSHMVSNDEKVMECSDHLSVLQETIHYTDGSSSLTTDQSSVDVAVNSIITTS